MVTMKMLAHMSMLLTMFFSVSVVLGEKESSTEVFQKLFRQKRIEHLKAIQQILSLEPEKQEKILHTMADKIMDMLKKARGHLEGSGFMFGNLDDSNFPQDQDTKNSLALVMENACFFADSYLRFPDVMEPKLKANKEWNLLFKWSLTVVNESKLIDESTEKLLDLISQELGLKPKDEEFHNPYRQERKKYKRFEELPPKKKKQKKKLKRGPQMSRSEL